jgi:hypothetical protein
MKKFVWTHARADQLAVLYLDIHHARCYSDELNVNNAQAPEDFIQFRAWLLESEGKVLQMLDKIHPALSGVVQTLVHRAYHPTVNVTV